MKIFKEKISTYLQKRILSAVKPLELASDRILMLQALQLSKCNQKNSKINDLTDVEFSVFSQWGEDGIIDWLIKKIPTIPKKFIEFGVGDYIESNTRLLLQLHNWSGLIIDRDCNNISSIMQQDFYWRNQLRAVCSFINAENINDLLNLYADDDIGLLSIDVDGNDYWIWKAIDCINPCIVVCEFNSLFGDKYPLTVPYDASFNRTEKHYSNLYFGASIKALIELASAKGYQFIGSGSAGVNAFFVRNDMVTAILDSINKVHVYCSQVREMRDFDGKLNFSDKKEQFESIKQMPVLNLKQNKLMCLDNFDDIHSDDWRHFYRVEF